MLGIVVAARRPGLSPIRTPYAGHTPVRLFGSFYAIFCRSFRYQYGLGEVHGTYSTRAKTQALLQDRRQEKLL